MKNEKHDGDGKPQDICERTFAFSVRIVALCRALSRRSSPDENRLLAKQLFRAGTSIGANVEEAHGSQSKPDYIAKMSIACKEARETRYWLRLSAASGMVSPARLRDIIDEAHQLVAILISIVKKCRENPGK